MNISSIMSNPSMPAASVAPRAAKQPELREAFDNFVGETFFSQMLSSMRTSVGKPAYFHGGRAEEIFQGQLDQILSQEFTKADGHSLTGDMFQLFNAPRR
ncbi:MAG: rod-binding protein [Planctomycetes bacterium]|nr:rod-binding protein [Planctomycetota bacterium]